MASKITNLETEHCLRMILTGEGYRLSKAREPGETGVDIVAELKEQALHIEVIGYKSSGPARAKDFYEAFFRAVSRLDDGATHCVVAISHLAGRGLPARARQHGTAWRRIGEAFPELEIWLVDLESERYDRYKWNDWAP